jgi:pyrroloquinoline-quinone synthase
MNRTELLAELDCAIRDRSLLRHPFYQEWQAGTLSREKLRLYAEQYYLHVEAFPVHLQALAGRASGTLRAMIVENLSDEQDPAAPHPKLWRDFATAVRVKGETLWTVSPLPGIRRLIETYREISRERPLAEAVAALYAYEAQIPEISTTKMEGLRRHYGVTTDNGLAYFRVHEEADCVHRAAWRSWLKNGGDGPDGNDGEVEEEQVLVTAGRALGALWGALDSVHEASA